MADGRQGVCKDCHKERVRYRRLTDPAVQAYDRMRSKTPKRRRHIRANSMRWIKNNPEGYRAHIALNNALRDGKIKKLPCVKCGDTRVHGHHENYSKPLDVIWMCAMCHHRMHAEERG